MKKFLQKLLLTIAFVVFILAGSQAQNAVLETFDYDDVILSGAGGAENGWAGPFSDVDGVENATISNKAMVVDGEAGEGKYWRDFAEVWADGGEPIYISFKYKVTDPKEETWGAPSLYSDDNEVIYMGKLWPFTTHGLQGYHVEENDKGQTYTEAVVEGLEASEDVTYYIMIETTGDDADDMAYLWFDLDEPEVNIADAVTSTPINLHSGINKIRLGGNGCSFTFDDFRMGKSAADGWNLESTTSIGKTIAEKYQFEVYPNPLCSSGIVNFKIHKNSHVQCKVIDLQGRTVTNVINEQFSPGNHHVSFTMKDLTNGIYFCELIIDNNKCGNQKIMVSH